MRESRCSNPVKQAVLLCQLGTPDAPTKKALRRYLEEFLRDPRVIEEPKWKWYPILYGIVLNTRPARSARLYSRIWTSEGSPLLKITIDQAEKLQAELIRRGDPSKVFWGMRYGSNNLKDVCQKIISEGYERVTVIPMYPQYASATTGSALDVVLPAFQKARVIPELRIVQSFHLNEKYIQALADTIEKSIRERPVEKLVLSYHGVPRKQIERGDVYCCHCSETTVKLRNELVKRNVLPYEDIIHTYQSRFGKEVWLTPYTDEVFVELGRKGIKKIAATCPGFTTDCLETLDEMGNEGSHQFKEAGGEEFNYINCLNDYPLFIEALADIAQGEELLKELSPDEKKEFGCSAKICSGCSNKRVQLKAA